MNIYIAASWKHQHAVEMMTFLLRDKFPGITIWSFVENNYGEGHSAIKPMPFEDWVKTEKAVQSFKYDTTSASTADLVIYIGPSGKDAAAEVGIAWAKGVRIIGLYAKGEDFGLMRKLIHPWFERYSEVLKYVADHK